MTAAAPSAEPVARYDSMPAHEFPRCPHLYVRERPERSPPVGRSERAPITKSVLHPRPLRGLVRQLMRGFGIAAAEFKHRSVAERKSQAHRVARGLAPPERFADHLERGGRIAEQPQRKRQERKRERPVDPAASRSTGGSDPVWPPPVAALRERRGICREKRDTATAREIRIRSSCLAPAHARQASISSMLVWPARPRSRRT